MKFKNIRNISFFFVFIFIFAAVLLTPSNGLRAEQEKPVTQSNLASPFDSLKKTYAAINTLEAAFYQKIYVAGIRKTREAEGVFLFKRGKGFLWQYTKPKGKMFLYDGRYMWQDDEDKTFVLKNKISREKTDGTFFHLVEDIARIDTIFSVKQQSIVAGMQYFELVPKKDSSVNMAKLWIDKNNLLKKIEIMEFTGNINTIEFSDIKLNPSIGDSKFMYRQDGKKEIVER